MTHVLKGLESWQRFLVAMCGICWGPTPLQAESPLSDFVAGNAAFYAEIEQLDEAWQTIEQSPLAARWRQTVLGSKLESSQPMQRWREIDDQLADKTGQTLTEHLRNLTAKSVALAVFVPENGSEPRGILLTRGRDARAIANTILHWNRLEKGTETSERSVGQHSYVARRTTADGKTVFYAHHAEVFVLSDHESLVKEAVQRIHADQRENSLTNAPLFQRANRPERLPGTCWTYIAPRAWDAVLSQWSDHSPGSELLLRNWRGVESLTWQLSLHETRCESEVQINFLEDQLSPAWTEFAAARAETPAKSLVPADALVVLGGHFQPTAVVASLRELLPTRERRDWDKAARIGTGLFLGRDLWRDFVGALLHDWQLYVVERPVVAPDDTRRHPFVAVWSSQFPASRDPVPRALAIENVVSFGLNALTAISTEQEQNVLLQRTFDAVQSRWMWALTGRKEGDLSVELLPDRLQVTTAIDSSPLSADPVPTIEATNTPFARTQRQYFPEATAYAWCSLATWRDSPTRAWIAFFLEQKGDHLRSRLVEDSTTLFDELYAAVTCTRLQLRVQMGGLLNPPAGKPE